MKKIFGIVSRIITAVTCMAAIAASVFVIPQIFGIRPCIVQSGSMEPSVHTGAVAFINTKDKDIHTGDIVTYHLGQEGNEVLVTHRVTGEENGMYTTKGDANDTEDLAPVTRGQIVGTYMFQIPGAGYLMAGASRKRMAMAAVWIFILNGMSFAVGYALDQEELEEKQNIGS